MTSITITIPGSTEVITMRSCDKSKDGEFIRNLSEANFRDAFVRTIGWDEALNREEPKFPERFTMLSLGTQTIGFISLRREPDCLYLGTIQLLPAYRNRGIGRKLMEHIECVAKEEGKSRICLRVFEEYVSHLTFHVYQCGFAALGKRFEVQYQLAATKPNVRVMSP